MYKFQIIRRNFDYLNLRLDYVKLQRKYNKIIQQPRLQKRRLVSFLAESSRLPVSHWRIIFVKVRSTVSIEYTIHFIKTHAMQQSIQWKMLWNKQKVLFKGSRSIFLHVKNKRQRWDLLNIKVRHRQRIYRESVTYIYIETNGDWSGWEEDILQDSYCQNLLSYRTWQCRRRKRVRRYLYTSIGVWHEECVMKEPDRQREREEGESVSFHHI